MKRPHINTKQILYMAIREIVEAKALTTSPKAIIHLERAISKVREYGEEKWKRF